MKFTRRKDLDTQTRLSIIIAALSCKGTYGSMTKLAFRHKISRTFLYQLIGMGMICLSKMLSVESSNVPSHHMDIASFIVLLKLEGKCSHSSISEILTLSNYSTNSVGMISELLTKYGKILPSTLSTHEGCHGAHSHFQGKNISFKVTTGFTGGYSHSTPLGLKNIFHPC
jgi:hypothetical protein